MKILFYELKRIRQGRMFFITLIGNLIYAAVWMYQVGISGIGGTAPFSMWTYLAFCGAMLPAGILTVLLLQANYYSSQQQKADILPLAASSSNGLLILVRVIALTVCFLLIDLLEFWIYALPNLLFFGKTAVLGYGFAGLLHSIPAVVAVLAAGGLTGKLNGRLVYVLAVLMFAAAAVQIAAPYDFYGNAFFSQYPLSLPAAADGEPVFAVHPAWVCTRVLYLAAGIAVLILCVCRSGKPSLDRAETA